MSTETWLKEFYPIPAEKVKKKDAIAHSLQKWRGLTKSALRKHEIDGPPIAVDNVTCSLCQWYFDHSNWDDPCVRCPLSKARNGMACDQDSTKYANDSPYMEYQEHGKPMRMIRLLEKALKASKK